MNGGGLSCGKGDSELRNQAPDAELSLLSELSQNVEKKSNPPPPKKQKKTFWPYNGVRPHERGNFCNADGR